MSMSSCLSRLKQSTACWLALSVAACSGPVLAFQVDADGALRLSDAQRAVCEAGDGCSMVSRLALQHALQESGESGYAQGLAAGKAAGYRAGLADGQRSASTGECI